MLCLYVTVVSLTARTNLSCCERLMQKSIGHLTRQQPRLMKPELATEYWAKWLLRTTDLLSMMIVSERHDIGFYTN